jgi:predicted SnoaL-like aldol condensation-catalyzing enzyme
MATGNKEIVRRVIEGVWTDDTVIDELISDDYIGHDPAMPETIRGRQGAKANYKQYKDGFEGAHITVIEQIEEGDTVGTRWEGRGTHTGDVMGIAPTGREIVVTGQTLSKLRDGKIIEEWTNWDTVGMLQQIGAIPTGAAATTA